MAGKVDLHIHSKSCSDGKLALPEIMRIAHDRGVRFISITDHDSIECQESAEALAGRYGMRYLSGLELNISFSHPRYRNGKPISLDILCYGYDYFNGPLSEKIVALKAYRRKRAEMILEKINGELEREGRTPFTERDLEAIEETVDGAFGRPHIANYMAAKGLASTRQEAFDRYLVKCNVPKMPVTIEEASSLIKGAGGKMVLAHPNDPNGTSLVSFTPSLKEQFSIIRETMLPFLDGVECWHPRHDAGTVSAYAAFAGETGMMVTGGSDCHQQPVVIGSVAVPWYVTEQFDPEDPKNA